MKDKVPNPLYYSCHQAKKLSEPVLEKVMYDEEKKSWTYYHQIGKVNVVTNVWKQEGLHPLKKKFDCECTHASLFGSHDIPCKHIFRLIHWLVENDKQKMGETKK